MSAAAPVAKGGDEYQADFADLDVGNTARTAQPLLGSDQERRCSTCHQGHGDGATFAYKVAPSGNSAGRVFATCDRCRQRKSKAAKGLSGTETDLMSLTADVAALRSQVGDYNPSSHPCHSPAVITRQGYAN